MFRVTEDVSLLNKCFAQVHVTSPLTHARIAQMAGKKYFTKFDMPDSYWQLPCSARMTSIYAFSTPWGTYEWCERLPMGDRNVPAFMTNVMAQVLAGLEEFSSSYIDDIFIFSDTAELHVEHVYQVLKRLHKHNFKVRTDKSEVGVEKIGALGFDVDATGYRPFTTQIEKFLEAPFPTADQLRCWMGLLNVFRFFLPRLDKIEAAFTAVRKKHAKWIVTAEMQTAFSEARRLVSDMPQLFFARPDEMLYLDVDASDFGCGALLYHEKVHPDDPTQILKEPIRMQSHLFSAPAVKWCTIEKEGYGIIKAVTAFEVFLLGRKFTLRTDHRNLLYMGHSQNARVQRWYAYLRAFDFTIEHLPGADNVVADALSRIFNPSPAYGLNQPVHQVQSSSLPGMGATASVGQFKPVGEEQPAPPAPVPGSVVGQAQVDTERPLELVELKDLFSRVHNLTVGHASIADTVAAIQTILGRRPAGLRQAVIRLIATCAVCAKTRDARKPTALEAHNLSGHRPFNQIETDFLVGLPTSTRGNNVVLVFVDTFTRYVVLYPTYEQTAKTVCAGLLQLYGTFGTPRVIVSDGASSFVNEGVAELCTVLNISHAVTHPHMPSSHGIVERVNREIIAKGKAAMTEIANANQDTWDVYLPIVQKILNSHVSAATGFAPVALMFGSDVASDLRLLEGDPLPEAAALMARKGGIFVRELDATLARLRANALLHIEDKAIKTWLASPTTDVTFTSGDYVLYANRLSTTTTLRKFAPRFCGPAEVTKRMFDDFYELKDLTQDTAFYAHARDLELFPTNGRSEEALRALARSDYNEFVVVRVDDHAFPAGLAPTPGNTMFKIYFAADDNAYWQKFNSVKYVPLIWTYIREKRELLPLVKTIETIEREEGKGRGMRALKTKPGKLRVDHASSEDID